MCFYKYRHWSIVIVQYSCYEKKHFICGKYPQNTSTQPAAAHLSYINAGFRFSRRNRECSASLKKEASSIAFRRISKSCLSWWITRSQNHFTAMTVSYICGLNTVVMVCSSVHKSPLWRCERGFLPTMHPQTNRIRATQRETFSKASRQAEG